MTALVERTCTELPKDRRDREEEQVGRPFSDYDSVPAYVLLGDPGSGKTTCFRQERRRMGDAAEFIPARDFALFDVSNHPEWRGRTLFIDGLDEIRAGRSDSRTALDDVLVQLDRLDSPPFRLSCREADWLGAYDRKRLEKVAPTNNVTVLRLDPLTAADAEKIAKSEARVKDATTFLQEAKAKGFKPLLANPQNLVLLIEAAADGNWPETRREMFELACQQLLQESNKDHLFSDMTRPGDNPVLDDAGRVCALLLLSQIPGVSLTRIVGGSDNRYPPVELLDPISEETATEAKALVHRRRLALSSRLFAAPSGDSPTASCLEPVHRHIAEFLAGRYLAKRIHDRLPPARVTALVTAQDGGVVTPHRGLCAWLAAHSKQLRPDLIERDPIGVGMYGDVHAFSNDEKRLLFSALIREGLRLRDLGYGNAAAFASLASPALEPELHHRLKTRPQDDDDQLSTEFVLRVLRHGEPMPALAEAILAIAYEPSWWPSVAHSAIDAFVRQCPDPKAQAAQLRTLLDDIYAGQVPDPDGELIGKILSQLYPDTIGPAQVWNHLSRVQPTKLHGSRFVFWTRKLERETPDDLVAILLDELVTQRPDLGMVDWRSDEGRAVAERLLARGLAVHGDGLTPQRLYDWLTAPAQTYEDFFALRSSLGGPEASTCVRAWLEANPRAYKAALLEVLGRYADEEDLRGRLLLAGMILRSAEPPADFGRWCLEQAQRIVTVQPSLARRLFEEANWRLGQGEHDLSQELLDKAAQEHTALRPVQQAFVRRRESDLRREATESAYPREREQKQVSRRQRRAQEWREAVRAEASALRQNRAAPALLSRLAWEWLGSSSQLSLLDWLREEFGGAEELARAAYGGLVGVFDRQDLPSEDEVIRLHCESSLHPLAMPFLAALKEVEGCGKTSIDNLSEDLGRLALVFHFCAPSGDQRPGWYRHLVERSPDLVESVLVLVARTELRRGREHITAISELAYDSGHRELARRASLTLLRGLPMRCHSRQLPNLIRLLWSALKNANRRELLKLIEKKLAGKSMAVAQRVQWLAAGLVASPNAYCERLGSFIDGKELRARQLASFLWSEPDLFRPDELSPAALEVVVRHLGRAFGRVQLKDGPVDSEQKAHWELQFLIQQIAESPAPEAGAALRRLALDKKLAPWRHQLRIASNRQATIARDTSYQTPPLAAVRATLADHTPANPADLVALALDRLDELAATIRSANTNVWSRFWNQDHGKPPWPKPENECRDYLLELLQYRLPDSVSAEKESQEVSDRRVDIRLSCADFHVPIEIKKDSNRDLWRAASDQLAAKYCRHVATDGHGVYVVLWFGDPGKIRPDGSGHRPGSAEKLQQRLEADIANQLTLEQVYKIAVRVIDVSKP